MMNTIPIFAVAARDDAEASCQPDHVRFTYSGKHYPTFAFALFFLIFISLLC